MAQKTTDSLVAPQSFNAYTYAANDPVNFAIAAYVGVAKLLQLLWRDSQESRFSGWLLTGFVGSMVYVAALLVPSIIAGWYDPYRTDVSLNEYVLRELSSAKFSVMLFTSITVPILGAFHYFEQIRNALKAWHSGSPPPRITN